MSHSNAKQRLTEVAPGIYRVGTRRINCYLVREGDALALLDTNLPKRWDLITAAIAHLGLSLSSLDTVLLTHVHSDHAGSAERARRASEATVHLHNGDAPLADGRTHRRNERSVLAYLWRPAAIATMVELVTGGGLRMAAIEGFTTVADNQVLDVPGQPRVIHLPGHTAGSIGFSLEERGVLFTGDALVTLNLLTGRTGPQLLPRGFTEDSGRALASLDRIATVDASTLLPGHGEPWRGSPLQAAELARLAGLT